MSDLLNNVQDESNGNPHDFGGLSDCQTVEISLDQYANWLIKIQKLDSIHKILESRTIDSDNKVFACKAVLEERSEAYG